MAKAEQVVEQEVVGFVIVVDKRYRDHAYRKATERVVGKMSSRAVTLLSNIELVGILELSLLA